MSSPPAATPALAEPHAATPAPPPEWTTAEAIADQLDRLPEPWRQKKRDTILALVDARLSGRSEETIWKRPEVCNRSTYHTSWRKDPIFADVLARCTAAAKHYQNTRAGRALAQAAEDLALASPKAVKRLVKILDSPDDGDARLAAVAILDRAGLETAAKTENHTVTSTIDDWRQEAERRRAAVAEMLGIMDDPADDADGQQLAEEAGPE